MSEGITRRKREIAVFVIVYGLSLVGFAWFLFGSSFWLPKGNALKWAALITYPVVIAAAAALAVSAGFRMFGKEKREGFWFAPYLLLATGICFAMMPLLQEDFLFMDDLSFYLPGKDKGDIFFYLSMFRPLAAIPESIFSGIWLNNAHVGRCITVSVLIALSWLMYFWIYHHTGRKVLSFLIALFLGVNVTSADIMAVLSVNPMLFGMCFACLSVFLYMGALTREQSAWMRLIYALGSLGALFLAFNEYAIATPIVFLLLEVRLFSRQYGRNMFRELCGYAVVMVVAGLAYVWLSRWAIDAYGIAAQESRSQFVFSLSHIIGRVATFFTVIFPQCVYRVFASLFGTLGVTIQSNNAYFISSPVSSSRGFVMISFAALCIAASLVVLWRRQGKFFPVLIGFAFILLADYSYLVLPDDTYMSYYVYPALAIILFMVIVGLDAILGALLEKRVREGRLYKYYLPALLCVTVICTVSTYASHTWASYCLKGQTMVRNALYLARDTGTLDSVKRVHIYGTTVPVPSVSSYPELLSKHILYEMGYDLDDIQITQSATENEVLGYMDTDEKRFQEICTPEELDILYRYYSHSPYFNFSFRNDTPVSEDDAPVLRELLNRAGLLPSVGEAAFVELREFYNLTVF